ncbi:hypothetical protein [Endozoicomonas sp.]|uniref:hypothetical protein n=1 Tax=Endozoicomonas sp. TaxID=1892382 RepID=UPI003AF9EECC
MTLKPINPNTQHKNEHTLYLGGSGAGKSQAVINNPAIPKKGRIILWDASGDHAGIHTEDKREFLKLLKAGIKRGSFRVAYAGSTVEDYEWFCGVVWAVLDGNHKTHVIAEELSQVCKHAGKASNNAAVLLNQGRKYGLVFHGVSQKPQEISKTYFDQCERKYIGVFRGKNASLMADYLASDLTGADISALQPLQFYYDDGQATSQPVLKKMKYKAPKGVKWL